MSRPEQSRISPRHLLGDRLPQPWHGARRDERRNQFLLGVAFLAFWAGATAALGFLFLPGTHTAGEATASVVAAAVLGLSITGLVYLYGSMVCDASPSRPAGNRRPATYVPRMSATTETVTGLTLHYRFPSEEDAELAPQTLGEALGSFDGQDLIEDVEDDVLGSDVVIRVSCRPSALAELHTSEDGLTGLLDNWASSSGGYLVV